MSTLITPFVRWPRGEKLVLASRSPRRAELLKIAGIPFIVDPPGEVEALHAPRLQADAGDPGSYAEGLAVAKAEDVAVRRPDHLVLGADTIVLLDEHVLEKPVDEDQACELLSRLAGREHTVITALALFDGAGAGGARVGHERTQVSFLPLSEGQIRDYVSTGEPMDKAGAYGIQGYGALMVSGVSGCYFNVMGLPLARLGSMLREVLAVRKA